MKNVPRQNTELLVLGLVTLLAVIGLVLLFQSSATGRVIRVGVPPSGVYAQSAYDGGCWKQCLAQFSYGSTAFAECAAPCFQKDFTGGGRHA